MKLPKIGGSKRGPKRLALARKIAAEGRKNLHRRLHLVPAMKRLATLLLFVVVFGAGSASCIFDDVEDPELAGAVFALVAVCLILYCAKCIFQSAEPEDEDEEKKRLASELA